MNEIVIYEHERVESVRPLFRRIGTETMMAARRGDHQRVRDLTDLVIAMEKVFPEEMQALRSLPPCRL